MMASSEIIVDNGIEMLIIGELLHMCKYFHVLLLYHRLFGHSALVVLLYAFQTLGRYTSKHSNYPSLFPSQSLKQPQLQFVARMSKPRDPFVLSCAA